jgi:hypothetical protein
MKDHEKRDLEVYLVIYKDENLGHILARGLCRALFAAHLDKKN